MFEAIAALIALTAMEIILGIDNLVFLSVATARLPSRHRAAGRRYGLLLALVTRVLLLCSIYWVMQLQSPLLRLDALLPLEGLKSQFYLDEPSGPWHDPSPVDDSHGEAPQQWFDSHAWEEFVVVTWRDLILLAGGLFLIYSSVREIHEEVELPPADARTGTTGGNRGPGSRQPAMLSVVLQIAVMDIIFSLDSVITAVGMADQLWVMIAAIVLAILVMIAFANQVGEFVQRHPTIKMLALSFLLLIGVMLCAEGIGRPINKGYIYFAMAFSLLVESINMRVRRKHAIASQSSPTVTP
ncbi:MAG: TerC family protein [Planctomycetota bacterium]|nr:MAG: TerC family protein [Planctomycetota bacterium]